MYKHTQPESWYTVSQCLSFNMKELCQAVISQYREDNRPSLYISEVQLSPKWHIDNNIHTCRIETKGKAFLIIDKQHIFTFPHFKMISHSSSTQCLQCEDVPIKNYRRTCLFRKAWQENTLPSVAALGEAINQLDLTWLFFLHIIFLIAPFVLHISFNCTRRGGNTSSRLVTLNVVIFILVSVVGSLTLWSSNSQPGGSWEAQPIYSTKLN